MAASSSGFADTQASQIRQGVSYGVVHDGGVLLPPTVNPSAGNNSNSFTNTYSNACAGSGNDYSCASTGSNSIYDSASAHMAVRMGALLGAAMKQLGGAGVQALVGCLNVSGAGELQQGSQRQAVMSGGNESQGLHQGLQRQADCVMRSLDGMTDVLEHGCRVPTRGGQGAFCAVT